MPICCLCCKENELKNSHAIPDTVFKKIFKGKDDSGKSIVVPGGGDNPVHYSSDSWDTLQLCGNCETLLNKNYEDYSIKVLRGALGQFKKHDIGVTFSQINTSKLINFFIAVFWRAANSKHDSYSKVYIPEPWNKQIGEMLLDIKTVPLKLATVRLSRLIDYTKNGGFSPQHLRSIVMSPFFRKHDYGHFSFCFVFEGFFVEIFTPGLKISERKTRGVINKTANMIMVPFIDIFDVPEIEECLVKGYGKHIDGHVTFES
ncbi:hypothetical protein [Shewanella morhuae]|uniref:HNH endonuclease 5 domain-containing protein n=1 Tax=Shewanella morhuae TaxID=365591 RepID=A0A380BZ37_9GAMM|nr:hypothetical protein [Shewanella morhuae]SUJ09782.1 Uncharacterised protein [Shewanella morhuae]